MNHKIMFGLLGLSLLSVNVACEGPAGADGADGTEGVDGSNGSDGANGSDGGDGYSSLVESQSFFEEGQGCEQGYAVTRIGVDDGDPGGTAGDGVLQPGEIDSEVVTCLAPDLDEDGFFNLEDNCPVDSNGNQLDLDQDGVGEACDPDADPLPMWVISKGSASTESTLYSYDLSSGTVAEIGPTGHALIALQVNPADGKLYATTRGYPNTGDTGWSTGGCDACLMEVNTSTGQATEVARMDVGPTPSLGFLSDGSLYGWTENSDTFISIDTSTGETVSLTDRVSSYGHHMGVTVDDRIMWVNGGGQFWEIETDGEMTQLGDLSETSSEIWDNVNAYGARGDISEDGSLWVGSEVTFGSGSPRIIVVRLSGDGPEVLTVLDAPEGLYFHAMTWTD